MFEISKRRSHPSYRQLPSFPPKRLLPLSPAQVEERRAALERFVQCAAQTPAVLRSVPFNGFLLGAQQEAAAASTSSSSLGSSVDVDVFLMNDQRVTARGCNPVMQTDELLEV